MTAYNPNVISFSRAVSAFRSGEDTPTAFLERCIEAIDNRESTVQAFETLNLEGARAAAEAATRRYREGHPLSMVDGCPVGIKDIMDTCDMPTQMGSPVFKGWQPTYDAACVQALRMGGAVIIGKTVTTAFACGATNKTRNPHDIQRTPGGSSSGSGAAVGAGMVPVALGTQTQGSTLRPASFCGVVGFKPTHGVLTMQGVHPISYTHDHMGILGGTLEDTWRFASHISLAQGYPGHPFLDRASEKLPRTSKPKRVMHLRTPGWDAETTGETRAEFERVLNVMRDAGVEIVSRDNHAGAAALETEIDEEFINRCLDITAYEMKWPYRQYVERYPSLLEQRVHDRMKQAAAMTPADYTARLATSTRMRKEVKSMLRGVDAVMTLAASGPAPLGHQHTGSRTFLVYATFLGLPAFSLPLMRVEGLPVGVQLIGAAGRDGALCGHARWLMQLLGH
jgi:Asp-tRNA(Asn)/Glu-tRNA(Gln) amidotransferase A subunit family amidase